MGWFSPKVKVVLINNEDGIAICERVVKADTLPERLDSSTTLTVGDLHWSVVDAQPSRREDYVKSRKVVIRLAQVRMADPRDVLFSLPSICHELPPCSTAAARKDDCTLHEDDWRQCELVACQFSKAIETEFNAIRDVHTNDSVEGTGWRKLHSRTQPDPPIPGTFKLADILQEFGNDLQVKGVRFRDQESRVADGFSIESEDG